MNDECRAILLALLGTNRGYSNTDQFYYALYWLEIGKGHTDYNIETIK